jgi:Asp-tRNA(Asn)/Glu-tRNA(Gln) amidotransferase A subunit family amidase
VAAAEAGDPLEDVMFVKLTQCFAAVASLGGCPVLTAPVGALRDGSPVAITLMAVQR